MNEIFDNVDLQKLNNITKKELSQDGWRKAEGEDLNAFKGYYKYILKHSKFFMIIKFFMAILLVLVACETALAYIMDDKNEKSLGLLMVLFVVIAILYIFMSIMNNLFAHKKIDLIQNSVYVIGAVAHFCDDSHIQIYFNGKKISDEKYRFTETVSPMDYIYDDKGNKKGFYVYYYMILKSDCVPVKAVLGNCGYRFYGMKNGEN